MFPLGRSVAFRGLIAVFVQVPVELQRHVSRPSELLPSLLPITLALPIVVPPLSLSLCSLARLRVVILCVLNFSLWSHFFVNHVAFIRSSRC